MRRHEFNAVFRAIQEMSWSQRRQLMAGLKSVQAGEEAHRIVEERMQWLAACPHGCGLHVVRNGMARGLQRYKCRDCGRTFNALTGTPLARLRYRERWLDQAQALIDGLSITKASQNLDVARSTAFRWRHRFLALPHHVKAGHLGGIVEADETCMLKSCKGQHRRRRDLRRKPRGRGGRATIRGMSAEHDIVLVVRDRSGACTDQIVAALDTAHLAAVLQPVLAVADGRSSAHAWGSRPAPDASVCTSCGVFENVRSVEHKVPGTGVGAAACGVVEAALGNQIGTGSGRAVMTVLGAVGGGFAGHEVEKRVRTVTRYEVRAPLHPISFERMGLRPDLSELGAPHRRLA